MQKMTSPSWILSIVTLLSVILWLFFSYVPTSLISLPAMTMFGKGSGVRFQIAALACLALFVLIQLMVVGSTVRMLRRPQHGADGSDGAANHELGNFKLNFWSEVFWTVLPLLMTLGLAFASYQVWASLRFS